jgi:hypothetical protein
MANGEKGICGRYRLEFLSANPILWKSFEYFYNETKKRQQLEAGVKSG